jgi:hypothetical protein
VFQKGWMVLAWPGILQRSRTKPPASPPCGYQHSLRVCEEVITLVIG